MKLVSGVLLFLGVIPTFSWTQDSPKLEGLYYTIDSTTLMEHTLEILEDSTFSFKVDHVNNDVSLVYYYGEGEIIQESDSIYVLKYNVVDTNKSYYLIDSFKKCPFKCGLLLKNKQKNGAVNLFFKSSTRSISKVFNRQTCVSIDEAQTELSLQKNSFYNLHINYKFNKNKKYILLFNLCKKPKTPAIHYFRGMKKIKVSGKSVKIEDIFLSKISSTNPQE